MKKKSGLPFSYKRFKQEFPEVEKQYDQLARTCHAFGPLNEKTRRLVKLGMAIGSSSEGAIKSHTRRALARQFRVLLIRKKWRSAGANTLRISGHGEASMTKYSHSMRPTV